MELRVHRVESTGSTQADVAEWGERGEPEGVVLLAGEQVAGRGRLGRQWLTPAGAGVAMSVLLRPSREPDAWTWLPLLAGVAVSEALDEDLALQTSLKWPNDVLLDGRKIAGILAEMHGSGDSASVVLGIGINLADPGPMPPGEPPLVPSHNIVEAISGTTQEQRDIDEIRAMVEAAVLARLADRYEEWNESGSAGDQRLLAAYSALSDTLGRDVAVALPGGGEVRGEAVGIDPNGALLVDEVGGESDVASEEAAPTVVVAGDVVHLR